MRAGLPTLLLVFTSLILLASGTFATPTGWGDETVLIADANIGNVEFDVEMDALDNTHLLWNFIDPYSNQHFVYYSKFDKYFNVIVNNLILSSSQFTAYLPSEMELDSNGNAHVFWTDYNYFTAIGNIQYAKIGTGGNILTTRTIASFTPGIVSGLSLDIDSQDKLHLAWSRTEIFYQKFNADGDSLFPPIQVSANSTDSIYPTIGIDNNGDVHFLWSHWNHTNSRSLKYVKYDLNGNQLLPIKEIVPYNFVLYSGIAFDSNNNMHLEWTDSSTVKYRVFDSIGNPITDGNILAYSYSISSKPVVDKYDIAYVPFYCESFCNLQSRSIYLSTFSKTHSPLLDRFLLENYLANYTMSPAIVFDSENRAHLFWLRIDGPSAYFQLLHKQQEPAPVLFVHGIYSDDALWDEGGPGSIENKVWQAGYTPFRVGEVLNQPGLYPNNTNFWFLRNQVKQAIQNIKQQTGAEKVDVVAHSMGGLVTRAYISSNDYAGDINNLIMLGTPNEGAPIAASPFSILVGFTQGDILLDLGRYSMIPYSPSLLLLNLFYDEKGVNHITIGGKKFTDSLAKGLAICLAEPKYCSPFNLTTDSIVPLYSANFTGTCVEAPVTHASILGDSLTMNAVVRDDVIRALKGQNLTLPPCSEAGGGVLENNIELSSYNGSISTGQYQTIYSSLYVGKPFSAFLSWDSNQDLRLEFTNPLGQTVHSGNYGSFPGTTYQREILPGGSGVRFSFAQPLVGNWSVHVRGGALSGNQNYTANLFLQKPVNVSVSVDQSKYAPNQSVIISTDLIDVNIPVLNATVSADVNSPSGVITNVVLYDDGNHSDGSANDGTYANSFASTSQEGTYIFDVSAAGTSGGHPFTIHSKNAFYVALEPDLQLDHVPLVVMPSVPLAGQRAFVQVDVNNIGNAQATHASIEFWDGEPANGGVKFYQKSVNVPAGQSVQIKTRWIPTSGTHTIVVFPSSFNPFLDANYANEKISKIVVVP